MKLRNMGSLENEKNNSKVLVVGGGGFIGSHLVSRLISRGEQVVVYDKNEVDVHGEFRVITGDLVKGERLEEAFDGVDRVVNFAAILGVFNSIQNPEKYFEINVMGTLKLLKESVKHKVRRFVQVSSDAIYGAYPLNEAGVNENFGPLDPPNPYAVSKLSQEFLARSFWHTHSLPVIVVRLSNVYGPGQAEKNMIWMFIEDADKHDEIKIFGPGTHGRDFTFVSDAVSGIIKALYKGKINWPYHISGGSFLTANELAKIVVEQIPADVVHVESNKAVISQGFLSNLRAGDELGYVPSVNVREGIAKCINHYLENKK